jgi:PTS system mannose-specific IIA component
LEAARKERIKTPSRPDAAAAGLGIPVEKVQMIGLVIVTHGRLAEEFVFAMEHVVGPQTAVAAICIGPDDDMERRRKDILDACGRVDVGAGVILLTDMFGGTPSNLAISVMEQTKAEVIAGLNLPMLIKLASVRTKLPLEDCVAHAQEAGRKYISVASYVLAGEK